LHVRPYLGVGIEGTSVIDANIRRLIDPSLARAGQRLAAAEIGADAVAVLTGRQVER